jgi:hypothetical protein
VRNVTTLVSKLNYSAVKQWPKVLTGAVAAALIFFNVSGLSIETKSPAALHSHGEIIVRPQKKGGMSDCEN